MLPKREKRGRKGRGKGKGERRKGKKERGKKKGKEAMRGDDSMSKARNSSQPCFTAIGKLWKTVGFKCWSFTEKNIVIRIEPFC